MEIQTASEPVNNYYIRYNYYLQQKTYDLTKVFSILILNMKQLIELKNEFAIGSVRSGSGLNEH